MRNIAWYLLVLSVAFWFDGAAVEGAESPVFGKEVAVADPADDGDAAKKGGAARGGETEKVDPREEDPFAETPSKTVAQLKEELVDQLDILKRVGNNPARPKDKIEAISARGKITRIADSALILLRQSAQNEDSETVKAVLEMWPRVLESVSSRSFRKLLERRLVIVKAGTRMDSTNKGKADLGKQVVLTEKNIKAALLYLADNPEVSRDIAELAKDTMAYLRAGRPKEQAAALAKRWEDAKKDPLFKLRSIQRLVDGFKEQEFGNGVGKVAGKVENPDVSKNFGLKFDGKRGHIETSLKHRGGAITLEAIVTVDDIGRGEQTIFSNTEFSGMGLVVNDKGRFECRVKPHDKNYVKAIAPFQIKSGEKYHVAGVFDGRNVGLFVNGRLVAKAVMTAVFEPSAKNYWVGADPGPKPEDVRIPLKGTIDGVRASKGVRYAKNFTPETKFTIPKNDNGRTLLAYNLDEGSGTEVIDASKYEHNGTIKSGVEWVKTKPPKKQATRKRR